MASEETTIIHPRTQQEGFGWSAAGGALIGGGAGAALIGAYDKLNNTKMDIAEVGTKVEAAKAGIYKDINDASNGLAERVDATNREVINNKSVFSNGLCDLGYKLQSDMRDLKDVNNANYGNIREALNAVQNQMQQQCCDLKNQMAQMKSETALQIERSLNQLNNGQTEIKCMIENTAKDQEIARLNRVVDQQRDTNIINSVVAQLKSTACA